MESGYRPILTLGGTAPCWYVFFTEAGCLICIRLSMGRKKSMSRGGRPSASFSKPTLVNGKFLYLATLSSGLAAVPLHPSQIPRLAAIADTFGLYRFLSVKIELYPTFNTAVAPFTAGVPNFIALGYYNDIVDTQPTNVPNLSELAYSIAMPLGGINALGTYAISPMTVPQKLSIPKTYLLRDTALKWYKANLGTMDTWDELQGSIVIRSEMFDVTAVRFLIRYSCEFSVPLPTASTPQDFEKHLANRSLSRRLLELMGLWLCGQLVVDDSAAKTFSLLTSGKAMLPVSKSHPAS